MNELEAETDLSDRVRRLVIAARVCAYGDDDIDAQNALDQATEAFAADIPWDES